MSSSGGIGGGAPRTPQSTPDATGLAASQGGTAAVPGDGGPTTFGGAQISADGQVSVNGVAVDLNTPDGAALLMGAVSGEELNQIKGMLQLKLVDTPAGPTLIPDDSFRRIDTGALRSRLGPVANDGGAKLDKELGSLFEAEKVPNPFNSNTTPPLYDKIKDSPSFGQAVSGLTTYFQNPTQANLSGFADYMKQVETQNPHGNIMELLFLVFRESIEETNKDKEYFLTKLKMFNDMGEALSGYLSELVDVSRDLGAQAAGAKYPEMTLTAQPVSIRKFDLSTTATDGSLKELSVERKRLDRAGLNDTIKEVESMQETVRNKRQMASTAFQNFDQKANQLYNLLSSVMKAMNEMRMGTVRNML